MQIDRTGQVAFNDASLNVWEEGISAARESGGWKGAEDWERQFKRDVFTRIVQTMKRIGWTITMPEIDPSDVKHYGGRVARWSAERKRYCVKGDLKADLSISGRCIELEFFQNVNAPDRPDHDGRYQSDKERHMPYLLRLEMERTRRKIRDYLCNVFSGYTFKPSRNREIGPGHGCVTAMEAELERRKNSGHYVEELGRASYSNDAEQSADGLVIADGMRVYAMDYRGRIVTGTAFYDLNGNWTIVTGRYGALWNVWHKQVWINSPGDLRRKRNEGTRRKRLEGELAKAIAAMDFRRAEVLKGILWPAPEPLFMVWHEGHQAYHCPEFCGYTSDSVKAGKFTAAELKGWDKAPNKVVPLASAA